MPQLGRIGTFPAFVALETLPVLEGAKRAASIQLDRSYYESVRRVSTSVLDEDVAEKRVRTLEQSQELFETVDMELDSVETSSLMDASERLRSAILRMPEVQLLRGAYPGDLRAVPEWLRLEDELNYGVRLYCFRAGEAPAPSEIVRQNVEGVVNDTHPEFDEYVGRVHSYPACCVDEYRDRNESAPEQRAVEPFASNVRSDKLRAGSDASVDEILPDFFDDEYAYSFFAREFFPEPRCDTARRRGEDVYDSLSRTLDEQFARDYFRLNYLFDYVTTRWIERGKSRRPYAGELGKEHPYFYLPLNQARTLSRYGAAGGDT